MFDFINEIIVVRRSIANQLQYKFTVQFEDYNLQAFTGLVNVPIIPARLRYLESKTDA